MLEHDDIDGFADRLLRLIDEPALREKFAQRSRELVAPFSSENGASLFIRHLRLVLGYPAKARVTTANVTLGP